MNKTDVLELLDFLKEDSFFDDFVIRKRDCCLIKKNQLGHWLVGLRHYNSFDPDRRQLALEINPYYHVRFDVLHKWFDKYTYRAPEYTRDDWSMGFNNEMLGTGEFYFLETRKNYHSDCVKMRKGVIQNATYVFDTFGTLEKFYKHGVEDVILGEKETDPYGSTKKPELGVRDLIATKLVAPSNYEAVKEYWMKNLVVDDNCKDPHLLYFAPKLPEIFADLEQTDFTKYLKKR